MKKLILILALIPIICNGATRYVATSGSDTNSGTTPATAWKTIQYGVNHISGGDTLYIGAGTYDESIDIPAGMSGSAGAYTTIKGTNVTVAWTTSTTQRNVIQSYAGYYILSGITVDMKDFPATQANPSCFAANSNEASNVILTNCSFLNPPRGQCILFGASAGGNNTITSCVTSNAGWGFVSVAAGDTFYHGMYVESDNNIIENNRIYGNGAYPSIDLGVTKNAGIQFYEAPTITNNIIRNNVISGPQLRGMMLAGTPGNPVGTGGWHKIYNNTISGVRYGVVIDYQCCSNILANNTFYGINYAFGNYEDDFNDGLGGHVLVNNIWANVTNQVFAWHADRTVSHLTNNIIYNSGTKHFGGSTYTEEGTITTDPKLSDPANGAFTLLAGSSALNAGKDLTSLFTTDKAGHNRRSTVFDIGAYQYSGTSYWVTKSGNDTNAGSYASPWLTIQKGLDSIVARDTLNIGSGTYDELLISPSYIGTDSDPTYILGTNVIVKPSSSTIVSDNQFSGQYVVLSGITFDGALRPKIDDGRSTFQFRLGYYGTNTGNYLVTNCNFYNAVLFAVGAFPVNNSGGYGQNQFINCAVTNWGNKIQWTNIYAGSLVHAFYVENPSNIFDGCTMGPPSSFFSTLSEAEWEVAKPAGFQTYLGSYYNDRADHQIIRNCTIIGPLYRAFSLWGAPGYTGTAGMNEVYNNTVVNFRYVAGMGYGSGTNKFYNNTFKDGYWGIWPDAANGSSNIVANNIFYNISNNWAYAAASGGWLYLTNNLVYNSGPILGSYYTEVGRVTNNPYFTSVSGNDFRLLSDSAAIDAAVNLSSVFTTDKAGVTRALPWDIGAYEYVASGDVTAPVISGVTAYPQTTWSTIYWTTDELSTSGLEWGTTVSYGSSATNSSTVLSHSLNASSLTSGVLYHYRVHSTDASGNHSVSSDGTFTTLTPAAPVKFSIGR